MEFNEYQALAARTEKVLPEVVDRLVHASLGMVTEAGEFVTEVKRCAIYEKPLTVPVIEHMIEELGDQLWYLALACNALGISMSSVARSNIRKLQERFPEKYSNEHAEARLDKGGLSARES